MKSNHLLLRNVLLALCVLGAAVYPVQASSRNLAGENIQAIQAQDDFPDEVVLENGFMVRFLGVDGEPGERSTWEYAVEELPGSQDLGYWVLALPPCAQVVSASPRPWEVVYPDPNTQLGGIKWWVGAGFQSGSSWVTVEGNWEIGPAQVAAKGPDVAYGEIAGPVCSENDAPVAAVDQVATQQGTPLTVDVLSNDTDLNGDTLVLADYQEISDQGGSVVRVQYGTPEDLSDDRLQYTPPPGFTGDDQFEYIVEDGYASDQGVVRVSVEAAAAAPIANPDAYTLTDAGLTVPAPGVLENDVQPQGNFRQATIARRPQHGSLALAPDGGFTYTPNPGFFGQDSFAYYLRVDYASSNPATVTLSVTDQTAPIVVWVAPVPARERYDVNDGDMVTLEVTASDNQAVSQVIFLRWDALANQYVTLAELAAPPYRFEFSASELNPQWNQVYAVVQDPSGNESNTEYIWLYKAVPVMAVFLPGVSK